MSELELIAATVSRAARRRRWQRGWHGLWRGLLAAAGLWLLALAVYKTCPVPIIILPLAGGAGLLLILGGFAHGWWRREPLLATARWIDERQQLQERLSTALELGTDPRCGEWGQLVVTDAARSVAAVDVRRLLPFVLPRASRWSLLLLALTAGLGFVPEYRSQAFLQKQREKEIVREAGRNLAELTKRTLEKRQPALEGPRQALHSVGELGDQLARNPVAKSEALRELAKMTERVQQEKKELGEKPALRAMERAARNTDKNTPATAEAIQKQIESLQKSMGSKQASEDAMEKLRKELQKAQQAAANMMGKDAKASDASRDSLAKALSQLSQQAAEMGASLPSLEEALASLKAGQIDQLMKDLQVAEKDLEKMRDLAQAIQKMQQQAEQIGKNLGEQLKNGQAEAAVGTLQKMINQLKAGELSKEQMQAMMDEVNKALDPASPYGKVPEHLKKALSQMQAGQKPGAAESLAQAAKELQELMQQLADAQDLKATMDALAKAQMCVGSCQGWGNKPGPPGSKPGGKPGRGVGTWADDDGASTAQNTGLWDNSGVDRPDRDPRGLSDRGEGQVPEGLMPTKVKGQFQPGSQMPSVTLKGVSIKGQSTVAVKEAIQAAQSEAQSALSHDQVPRAYAGTVKDYFDDIKK